MHLLGSPSRVHWYLKAEFLAAIWRKASACGWRWISWMAFAAVGVDASGCGFRCSSRSLLLVVLRASYWASERSWCFSRCSATWADWGAAATLLIELRQHWQLERVVCVSGTAGCAGASAAGTSTTWSLRCLEFPLLSTGTALRCSRVNWFDKSLTATASNQASLFGLLSSALATVASVAPCLRSFDFNAIFWSFTVVFKTVPGRSNPC